MFNRKFLKPLALVLTIAFLLFLGSSEADAQKPTPPYLKKGRITMADRKAAAANAKAKGLVPALTTAIKNNSAKTPVGPKTSKAPASGMNPGGTPDYFGTTPNYATSPLPPTVTIAGDGTGATAIASVNAGVITSILVISGGSNYTNATISFNAADGSGATAQAVITNGAISAINVLAGGSGYGGIRKFVDTLPGLCDITGTNNLNQCLSIAKPDTTTYPGSDYYVIELGKYKEQLHSDLSQTQLEGYRQVNTADPYASKFSYLGPTIIAQKDRPVRVKFINNLGVGSAGDLFLPVDTTVMGAGEGPKNASGGSCDPMTQVCESYMQNRATLHLHGGNTPWISDGTQHQWTTPAGQATQYPQGVSVKNVPDMDGGNEPQGTLTFYYTNQQSARLMFYHDHAYGITRLNVYAGQAAGYVLRDSAEAGLETNGVIPGLADNIPLIIQDKTFVPGPNQLAAQDPTWDKLGFGNLWFPHVYMTNQNPYDPSGANAMGRWDYGPWFWPPFTGITNAPVPNPLYDCGPGGACTRPWEPPYMPATPNPTIVPEGFMDTPLVNGTAYPTLTVDPKAYRFRILNAANDRFWNLQLYKAVSNNAMWDAAGNLLDPNAGEVKMVPFDSTGVFPASWGMPDARAGGVPDPNTLGPSMIQIGTEGGFLPAPYVVPTRPINYNYNRRDVTVLNVQEKALFLGPAERADVIVDFSQFAGQTLILYSDSPAPVPAADPRIDYYTGNPDQVAVGGAPSTLPGYGPNTRTIMQIKVNAVVPAPAYNLGALQTALPGAYAQIQDKPLVPESTYNTAFGASYPDNFVRIQDNTTMFFNGPLSGVQVVNGGNGYTTPPSVNITGGGGTGAMATASLVGTSVMSITVTAGGSKYKSIPTVTIAAPPPGGTQATASATIDSKTNTVTGITVINGGAGYTSAPAVTISGGGGTGATAKANIGAVNTGVKITLTNGGSGYTSAPTIAIGAPPAGGTQAVAVAVGLNMTLQPKSIIENFDMDYGRMNALLGVEIPNTTGMNQTSIPYTDVDPATEIFKALPASAGATPIGTGADGTQIWKITHNGVDTHALHWHMFNVQVINRVGWDGAVRFPDPNELGWKDTVRMNPLEDIIIALRPIIPTLPWDLPNSIRPLDVTSPVGSTMNFSGVDPSGQPAPVTNQLVNFGWEYVWHCHLLGHEENIMMRPIIFGVAPKDPSNVAVSYALVNKKKVVTVTWKDNSLNETSFTVLKSTSTSGPWQVVNNNVAAVTGSGSTVTFKDQNATTGTWYYRVIANNTVGYTQTYAAPAVGYPNLTMTSGPVTSASIVVP